MSNFPLMVTSTDTRGRIEQATQTDLEVVMVNVPQIVILWRCTPLQHSDRKVRRVCALFMEAPLLGFRAKRFGELKSWSTLPRI